MQYYLPRLTESAARWVRFGALLLGITAVLFFGYGLRYVLTPIAIALALAYMLNPIIDWLEKHDVSRVVSVSAGLALILTVAGVMLLAATLQVVKLSQRLPGYVEATQTWLAETVPNLYPDTAASAPADSQPASVPRESAWPPGTARQIGQWAQTYGLPTAGVIASWMGRVASQTGYIITTLILVPVYSFFFMLHFNTIIRMAHDHIPQAYRPTVLRVVTTIDRSISNFFRGRLVVAALVGALNGLGWYVVGVPYAFALGLGAGVLQLVPFMGVLVLPFAMLSAYMESPPGEWLIPVALAFAVYMAVQALESFVIAPYVDARSSGLHPVTTIVVLMIGAELAGLLGMLLSIPIASTIKSLGIEYALPEIRRLAGIESPKPTPVPYTLTAEPAPDSQAPKSEEPPKPREPNKS